MSDRRLMIICIIGASLFSGCAVGFMQRSTSDPKTGINTKTDYSPMFASDSVPFADGAEFKVSAVITRVIEPVSYNLLQSIGALPPEDLESPATVVVHFKNSSQKTYRIHLEKIKVLNEEIVVNVPEITLKPGDRFNTKTIPVKVATYDLASELELNYTLDDKPFMHDFWMRRQTIEELKQARNTYIAKSRSK